jgi:hypothetical protein
METAVPARPELIQGQDTDNLSQANKNGKGITPEGMIIQSRIPIELTLNKLMLANLKFPW